MRRPLAAPLLPSMQMHQWLSAIKGLDQTGSHQQEECEHRGSVGLPLLLLPLFGRFSMSVIVHCRAVLAISPADLEQLM